MEELFVISKLDNQRNVEGILQILSEDEGHQVTQVHRFSGGTSSSVKIERNASFVVIQNDVQVSVGKEDFSG